MVHLTLNWPHGWPHRPPAGPAEPCYGDCGRRRSLRRGEQYWTCPECTQAILAAVAASIHPYNTPEP